jgi:uncharacterized protein YigA (DUF484 family)
MRKVDLEGPLSLDESLVAAYLEENPDFFHRHPELVSRLRVPHQQRGTVSLVEIHQQRLRQKVEVLEQEITDLLANASHNERIYLAYVNLLPELMRCQSFAELEHRLRDTLIGELGVADVSLRLNRQRFQLPDSLVKYGMEPEQIERLRVTRLGRHPHYFGRLTLGEQAMLFTDGSQVSSVAMIPLGPNAQTGLFTAASRDADHYMAGMDSLLLGQLCDVVATLVPELVGQGDT